MTAFVMEDFLREILVGQWNEFSAFTTVFSSNIAAVFTMANRILLCTHPFGELCGTQGNDSAHRSYSAEDTNREVLAQRLSLYILFTSFCLALMRAFCVALATTGLCKLLNATNK